MKKRVEWIDIAKGLGILLVIYGHAAGGIMNAGNGLTSGPLMIPYNIIYGFHMPLFFFLSGIFATHWVQRSPRIAIKQKVTSLVIPYFIWTIITGSIMTMASRFTNSGLGVKDILISPIAPFSEYWFLYVLFVIFIVYYFGRRIISDNGLVVMGIIFFLIRPLIYHYWIFDAFSINFVCFMIGTKVLQNNRFKELLQYSNVKFAVSLFLFVVVNWLNLKVLAISSFMLTSYFKIFTIVIGIGVIIYLSQFVQKNAMIKNVFSKLGKISMAIYVMHLIPIAGARIVAMKLLNIHSQVALSLVISMIALVVCLIGYYLLEKLKIGRISFGQK